MSNSLRHVGAPVNEVLLELLTKERKRRKRMKARHADEIHEHETALRNIARRELQYQQRCQAAEEVMANILQADIEHTNDDSEPFRLAAVRLIGEYERRVKQHEL